MNPAVDLQHIAKIYAGKEVSKRGTSLQMSGPALWFHNLSRALQLTAPASPRMPDARHGTFLMVARPARGERTSERRVRRHSRTRRGNA